MGTFEETSRLLAMQKVVGSSPIIRSSQASRTGASILQVQNWMGHADVKTTMRYLHHKSHASDADLLDEAASAAPSWEPVPTSDDV